MAGTVGGDKYGVCKSCKLVGVKVMNSRGSGSIMSIMNGIRWAKDDCKDGSKCVISKLT